MTDVEVVVILALLGVKHFLADFVWQFDYMIQQKGFYGQRGGLDHSAIHAGLTFVVLVPFMWPIYAISLALLDGIVHYHIDWAKMRINRDINLTPQDRKFWFWFGLDQLAHFLTYVLIIAILIL